MMIVPQSDGHINDQTGAATVQQNEKRSAANNCLHFVF